MGALINLIGCKFGKLLVVDAIAKLRNMLKHGMANKTKTYSTWKEMRQRCLNPNSDKAKWYSEKGGTICQSWLESFQNFLNDMGERPEGMTLDRINPYGNYDPSNCRWATPKEQANNTRKNSDKMGMLGLGGLRTFEKTKGTK